MTKVRFYIDEYNYNEPAVTAFQNAVRNRVAWKLHNKEDLTGRGHLVGSPRWRQLFEADLDNPPQEVSDALLELRLSNVVEELP